MIAKNDTGLISRIHNELQINRKKPGTLKEKNEQRISTGN